MRLKNRILLTVIPLMVLFAVFVNVAFGLFFQKYITQQEDSQINTAINNLTTYLNGEITQGRGSVNDWGHWDDTYHFVETRNAEYIRYNLAESTLANLSLNFMIFMNSADEIIYQQYYALDAGKFSQFPQDFQVTSDFISFVKLEEDVASILKIGENYYFIYSTDITDSEMTKPTNGKLIIGRGIDASIIENIETITGNQLNAISPLEWVENSPIQSNPTILSKINSASGETIDIRLAVPNAYRSQDSIRMDFEMPRTLYVSSMKNVFNFAVLDTVLFAIACFVVIVFFTNILTKPFKDLLQEVSAIVTTKNEYPKLAEIGNIEFLYLRKSINNLLTKIEENQARITSLALFDQLTGIPNRILFNDLLLKEISLSSKTGKKIGVVFLDLDNFKSVNDTLGHEMGDELIRQVSVRLADAVHKQDTVARFGGDEFLLILNNLQEINDLPIVIDKVMTVFHQPFVLNGMEYFVTCSAGVSVYPEDGGDSDTLVKNADIAMYSAKNDGKNTYSFSSLMMRDDLSEKIELTNYLYRAQERNELEIYYQPQISVANRKIVGFEALLRWNHPTKGQLLPRKFIQLAEHTRLINPIGKWVLETVCQQKKHWTDLGFDQIRIAVNMSLVQFLDPELLDMVKNTIIATKIDPRSIEIEITESMATNKSINIEPILHALKEVGMSIAIDDFGTEYSSLARLKYLSIDRIKMDMQFVHSISVSDKDDAIAKIIIQLAKNLNLNVIAEGIETENQMNFLSMNACDEVQGYYYYRPMKAEDAEKLLLEQR